jgi:hypothetical protein
MSDDVKIIDPTPVVEPVVETPVVEEPAVEPKLESEAQA